ncbi:MAG: c-type cytochrome [Betaproteobacteria bacterium]|nr:c-type cytochrome [Betaproteobacteria bacterium]
MLCLVVAASAGSFHEAAWAGDAAAGRVKVRAACQTCHGEDGKASLPGAGNLSGQQKEYLIGQLRAFRSGSRRNEQMSIIAKPLTDAEIENVSEWYSSIQVTVEAPK